MTDKTMTTSPDARPVVSDEAVEAGLRIHLSSVNLPAGECLHASDVREILTAALPHMGGAVPDEAVREVWDNATNAVCQEMQAREMCNCPDGECLAAKVEPSPADFTAALLTAIRSERQQPTHRHKKRGSEYVLIGIGRMQSQFWHRSESGGAGYAFASVDMREVAIYRSVDDGSLWARPREEFEDGRFETLPAIREREG